MIIVGSIDVQNALNTHQDRYVMSWKMVGRLEARAIGLPLVRKTLRRWRRSENRREAPTHWFFAPFSNSQHLDEKTFIGILITTQRDSDGSNV